jgi:spore coat protein CotH
VDPGDPGDFPGDPQFMEPVHAYVPALASLGGGSKTRLGIRIKGNASLLSAIIDKRSNYPFKIDVNYYKSGQNLDGIKKFNLHPVVSNDTTSSLPGGPPKIFPGGFGLEEFLSYGAFRAFGVPASRTGWMDVYLNGKYLGLYTVLENTDSTFMERNFGSPGGSTYKPEGEYLEWKGAKYDKYPFLNWKGGGDGTHQSIIRLMDVINHKPVARFPSVIDVQSILNYTAVNVALGNWDTYEALGHNYLLHEGSPGRFYMLPWDLNLSQSDDPGYSLYGKIGQPDHPPEGFEQPTPALTHRLYRLPEIDARYRATLKAFIDGPGSQASLNARIDDAVALLGSRLDESAIKTLRENIGIRIGRIKKLLKTPAAR